MHEGIYQGDLLPRARIVLVHILEMEASSWLAYFGPQGDDGVGKVATSQWNLGIWKPWEAAGVAGGEVKLERQYQMTLHPAYSCML